MQSERDHLVRFVFPRLRQELLQRRIHLVDVDLRWGVTSDQDAMSVCREVVDECRPRFLCMLGGRYGWVPPGMTRSITADEVYYGVLDRDLAKRGFAYFYFRDPSATAAMVEIAPGEFREPADSHGAVALAELKNALVEAGLQPFIYRAQWDGQSRRLISLKEFGDRVCADLKQSIDQEFGPTTGEKPDEFTEESAAVEAFIEERVQRFVLGCRQPVWNELRQHAESTGGNGYLCLTGAAGSGKSALLGKLYQDYRVAHPQYLVIPHFVGASPGSTDVRRTLRRLCHELATGAGLTAEIPEDPEKLRGAFVDILQQAAAKKRVVILLDAINQFDPTTLLAGWSWLPEELPATARIILSTLGDPALESLWQRHQPPRAVELQPLDTPDREAIIGEFLHRYRKSITDDQRAALVAKTDSGTPLYLLVALEELRTLGTYEEITDRIAQLPSNTQGLFIWVLKRLEDDDGFRDTSGRKIGLELVSRFVSMLDASRHGLSRQELVELLSPGDAQGNVAALVQLLRPYLMQRGELLDFYHGQFRLASSEKYLATEDTRKDTHAALAHFFDGLADPSRNNSFDGPTRALEELPFHLDATGGDSPSIERLIQLARASFVPLILERTHDVLSARSTYRILFRACFQRDDLSTALHLARSQSGLAKLAESFPLDAIAPLLGYLGPQSHLWLKIRSDLLACSSAQERIERITALARTRLDSSLYAWMRDQYERDARNVDERSKCAFLTALGNSQDGIIDFLLDQTERLGAAPSFVAVLITRFRQLCKGTTATEEVLLDMIAGFSVRDDETCVAAADAWAKHPDRDLARRGLQSLVDRCSTGKDAEFGCIVTAALSHALYVCGDRNSAEDLAAQALEKAPPAEDSPSCDAEPSFHERLNSARFIAASVGLITAAAPFPLLWRMPARLPAGSPNGQMLPTKQSSVLRPRSWPGFFVPRVG